MPLWQIAEAADAKRTVTKTPLQVQQVGEGGESLRVSLPPDTQPDDRIAFVIVTDKAVKDPAALVLMPEGDVDKAIVSMNDLVKRLGEDNMVIHQQNSFNNGVFNCCSQPNSNKKRGMLAWCSVGKDASPQGVCVTYFNIPSWATDKKGTVEIPLPTRAPGVQEEPLPRSCELFLWLIAKDGRKVAEGKFKVVRK